MQLVVALARLFGQECARLRIKSNQASVNFSEFRRYMPRFTGKWCHYGVQWAKFWKRIVTYVNVERLRPREDANLSSDENVASECIESNNAK